MERFKVEIEERTLHFKQPAGTSRGVYTTRTSWFVTFQSVDDPSHIGIGECAPLPDLSCDASPQYARQLAALCRLAEATQRLPLRQMNPYPSMAFGLETAWKHYTTGTYKFFDTAFSRGEAEIPINGLVWMGSYDEMLERMQRKLDEGFRCVKLKIGAIDFDKEIELMRIIRESFTADMIELRVDANGAFSPCEAMSKLEAIARYSLHSIEQPIRQGQWREMAKLCKHSPLPIALDEELIGLNSDVERERMLDAVEPQYIVIKPSLHGGMAGTEAWVDAVGKRGIDSWITSALESNVGLNAIAQLTANIYGDNITMPQGLGTGMLFTDNVDLPYELAIEQGAMRIKP